MAHANANARREAVSEALKKGPLTMSDRKALAARFECSGSAIYADMLAITHDEGRKTPGTRHVSHAMRKRIQSRDGGICQYCDSPSDTTIVEHIVPASRGGLAIEKNLVVACQSCNTTKRSEVWIPRNLSSISDGDDQWIEYVKTLASA